MKVSMKSPVFRQRINEKRDTMEARKLEMLAGICSAVIFFIVIVTWSTMLHAAGSTYPERPITLVVPFGPGGSVDLSARNLAAAMEKRLKQPVVVVNKPGASMTIGGYAVASAKPDGYTLGLLAASGCIPEVFTYFYSAPYSSADFRPICPVTVLVLTVTVKEDAPWNSLRELIEFARKNPRMKYGHNGRSMVQYMAMATIAKVEKVDLVDVPFDGDPSQVTALLGGNIPVITPTFSPISSLLGAKKVKVLAVLSQKADFLPDVPSIKELGYDVPAATWTGLFAPKGTPDDVIRRIYEVVQKIREEPDFQNSTKKLDLQVAHEDRASFEKSILQFKEKLSVFFKEEGMEKPK